MFQVKGEDRTVYKQHEIKPTCLVAHEQIPQKILQSQINPNTTRSKERVNNSLWIAQSIELMLDCLMSYDSHDEREAIEVPCAPARCWVSGTHSRLAGRGERTKMVPVGAGRDVSIRTQSCWTISCDADLSEAVKIFNVNSVQSEV